MQNYANKAIGNNSHWKTFSGFYWVFFPKNTEMAGQSTLEYLSSEAPHFDYNVLDQTTLAKQFVLVETKLEAIQHNAIKQLTH